ncbi:AsmA-like C-terminal region-containing protein [soil metagenome]
MKKFTKYFLRGFIVLIGVCILLFGVTYFYVSYNKERLIKQITEQVSRSVSGNVKIESVSISFLNNFPEASVVLHNVSITDTQFNVHKHSFLIAEDISVTSGLTGLFDKEISIKKIKIINGVINFYTDTSGYTNKYLLAPKKTDSSGSGKKLSVQKIVFKNVKVLEQNERRNKQLDLTFNNVTVHINSSASSIDFKTDADIVVHQLAFNLERGSFINEKKLTGDFKLIFNKANKSLQFIDIDLKINKQRFTLTGYFELKGPESKFSLQINTTNLDYAFGKSLLTKTIASSLSIVAVDKPVDVSAKLSGEIKGSDPLIVVDWSIKNSLLKTPFIDFENTSVAGFYTNEVTPGLPRKDPNSKIEARNFSATWRGLQITSPEFIISDLAEPKVNCRLQSKLSLEKFNDILQSNALDFKSGNAIIDISYIGPAKNNNRSNSFINGSVAFYNGSILYLPRDVELSNASGKILFRNTDVYVENLKCTVLENSFVMNGSAKNLLTLINNEPDKALVNWNIFSPTLDLNKFIFLLKSPNSGKSKKSKPKLAKMSNSIDRVLADGTLHFNLKTDRLLFRKFSATNINADVYLAGNKYELHDISMNHAGGSMSMKGYLAMQNNYHNASVSVNMNNVDVKKVFQAFENFGQDGITDESLQGTLNTKLNAAMNISQDGKVIPGSVHSIVDFTLNNGALINYEPVKKLQRSVFKKRDFDNIQFAVLKDKLEIAGQQIRINRMEIESTVLRMFIEGVYSLNGNSDINIQIPLNNLKKRRGDYIPENIGVDQKTGMSIYMRGRPGPDGKMDFKLNLSNKYKKEHMPARDSL